MVKVILDGKEVDVSKIKLSENTIKKILRIIDK